MVRVLALCLAALALVAAGCGGGDDSRQDYERQVSDVNRTLEQAFGNLVSSIRSAGSTEQAAAQLDEGASSLDQAAQQLAAIDPPDDVEAPHQQLVSGLRGLADEFRKGAEAAREGDVEELREFAEGFRQSAPARQITEAGERIAAQGYEFESGRE